MATGYPVGPLRLPMMSDVSPSSTASAQRIGPARRVSARGWTLAGYALCTLMLGLHVAAGLNSAGQPDSWRDAYWATAIAHGEQFPLAGPPIYGLFELGPWWFYLLALPVRLTGSIAAMMAFVQALAAAKYFLARHMGARLAGARFGFVFAASMSVCGWSLVPLLFPSHTALVETCVLLLALASWRFLEHASAFNAVLLGIAGAACLHAHPSTLGVVACAFAMLAWTRRSKASVWLHLALAAAILALALLPPWLDRDASTAHTLKPVMSYLGGDLFLRPLQRIPVVAASIVSGGAWWGPVMMTRWSMRLAAFAQWILCGCLLIAAWGMLRPGLEARYLSRLGLAALALFLVQVGFVVAIRPITPMWMVSSCLPPLAFAIAVGLNAWLGEEKAPARALGAVAVAAYLLLALALFPAMLRDNRTMRWIEGANPLLDVVETGDRVVDVPLAFYPVRRLDRLSRALCEPAVLHANLAAVVQWSFGATLRNVCGRWPEHVRFGGVEGDGAHVAGISPQASIASGIAPSRVVDGMALYEDVVAVAPKSGSFWRPLRRLQIVPDSGPGPATAVGYAFRADPDDVVVVTNRLLASAPMHVGAVLADGRPARTLFDGGGSFIYGCDQCKPGAPADWHVDLDGVQQNLDVIVLRHRRAATVEPVGPSGRGDPSQ